MDRNLSKHCVAWWHG